MCFQQPRYSVPPCDSAGRRVFEKSFVTVIFPSASLGLKGRSFVL